MVTHDPQFPARQPESILMPFASANSKIELDALVQLTERFEFTNFTSSAGPSAAGAAAGLATFFTVAGPNAS